jgi:FkbM family methyltransferase
MQYEENKFTTPWGVELTVFTRKGTNDWNTLYSCITEDEYKVGSLAVPTDKDTVAVDIGGHAGGCSLALLSRGFKVIAVEPLPENAELIMKNVKANGWEKNFTLHSKAINEVSGKQVVLRYGNEKTESGSHHRFIGNTIDSSEWQENLWTDGREIKVDTISIDDILNNVKAVTILKIDCEGAEWSAFTGASEESLEKIDKIVAELHALPTTESMYEEFHDLIGKDFKNTTDSQFEDVQNYETIGLAYFEK